MADDERPLALVQAEPERALVPSAPAGGVSLVIPAFNEEAGIGAVLERLSAMDDLVDEIIIVDDGSTDRTAEIVEEAGHRVIRHHTNRGYGASLKTGLRAAKSEFVLTMDADGQHQIEDAVALISEAAGDANSDLIIGNRTALIHSPLWRMPGKWFLTRMAEFLVQRRIPDLNSGLRLIRRDTALKYVSICPSGFSFSTTITMACLSRGYAVSYVPIQVQARKGQSSVRLSTGFQTIMLVLRLAALFNPLRIFLPASALSIIIGIAWAVPYVLRGQGVTVAAMLAVVTGVILFALGIISDQLAQMRLERYE